MRGRAQLAYCENEVDCRRVSLLAYLGEMDFDRRMCRGTCDNCTRSGNYQNVDVTSVAKQGERRLACLILPDWNIDMHMLVGWKD